MLRRQASQIAMAFLAHASQIEQVGYKTSDINLLLGNLRSQEGYIDLARQRTHHTEYLGFFVGSNSIPVITT